MSILIWLSWLLMPLGINHQHDVPRFDMFGTPAIECADFVWESL